MADLAARTLALLIRWRWAALSCWALTWLLARHDVVGDWSFFQRGARLLLGPDPLSLYARAPELQIGPLALLASLPLVSLHPVLVQGLLHGLGLLALRAVECTWPQRRPGLLLVGGLVVVPSWAFVVTSRHLDDALVVLCTALAALAVSRDRALAAGLLTGAALAAKPWAVVVLPLVLGLSARRPTALLAAVGVPAAAWLPFVLGDPHTVSALQAFRIPVAATSGLQLLGVSGATPDWVPPAQAALGLALALLAARQGRWELVPAAGLAVRVALDPGAMGYYAAALAVAVLLAEGFRPRLLPPGSVVVVAAGLFLPAYLKLQPRRRGWCCSRSRRSRWSPPRCGSPPARRRCSWCRLPGRGPGVGHPRPQDTRGTGRQDHRPEIRQVLRTPA